MKEYDYENNSYYSYNCYNHYNLDYNKMESYCY